MDSSTRHLWLVRHGARLDVADPSWIYTAERPHDTPLAPDGLIQSDEVGRRLVAEGIQHLFASPFLRALQTADRIAQALDLPIQVEHGLCEAYYPNWFPIWPTFLPADQIPAQFPRVNTSYQSAVTPVHPETPEALRDRTSRTIQAILSRFSGNIVIVSHGGAINSLCAGLVANGRSVHVACCCLIQLSCHDNQWTLVRDGRDVSHLSRTESTVKYAFERK